MIPSVGTSPTDGLAGRTVIVTGAASGIGEATVHRLLIAGAQVVALDLNPAVVRDWGSPVICEVGDAASEDVVTRVVQRATEEFGAVHGAVAAAGIAHSGSVTSTPLDEWNHVLRVNLSGVFLLANAVVPELERAGGGSFVAIASQLGMVGYPMSAPYCSAKAGVINLMRSIAIDYASVGVRANCVCPGPTNTPMTRNGLEEFGQDASVVIANIPAGRLGEAHDVASSAAFLLSDEAAFINGSAIVVDGGYIAR
jgi:NAD(P)-dependent dehydrogenase (short-subunit alcohol dehydrogenase family)